LFYEIFKTSNGIRRKIFISLLLHIGHYTQVYLPSLANFMWLLLMRMYMGIPLWWKQYYRSPESWYDTIRYEKKRLTWTKKVSNQLSGPGYDTWFSNWQPPTSLNFINVKFFLCLIKCRALPWNTTSPEPVKQLHGQNYLQYAAVYHFEFWHFEFGFPTSDNTDKIRWLLLRFAGDTKIFRMWSYAILNFRPMVS